jgi:hypothetical protein
MVEGPLLSMSCTQNLLWYRANGQLLASWFKSSSARLQQSYDASNTGGYHRELSVDECRLLLSSGQLRRFLSRYAVEYIPLGSGFWEPTEIKNDRQMMSRIRRLRTLATLPACDETQRPTKVLVHVFFCCFVEVTLMHWFDRRNSEILLVAKVNEASWGC